MQYRIEKNTVQETLIIPLYARKMCTELYPNLYRDETAVRLFGEIDYDFSALEKKAGSLMQRFGFLEVAMRQNDLAFEVRDYLRAHLNAAVVNLGCGLDATGRSCGNGSCKLYVFYYFLLSARPTAAWWRRSMCRNIPVRPGTRADLHRRAGREYHQEPEKAILLCAAGTVVPEALQL